jgi:hypothetical protein
LAADYKHANEYSSLNYWMPPKMEEDKKMIVHLRSF